MLRSNYGRLGNLIFVLFLLLLMLAPDANSLMTYTAAVVITPIQPIITILDPNSARMLKDITAESGADSSAADSEDIRNLLTDNGLSSGKEILNYAENNKDFAHWYRLNLEPGEYYKVEVRVYFSALEVTPYEWRVFVYQSDANNINTGYYVDGSSSVTGWTTIDVTSIIHQLDGEGFMKVRLISRIGGGNAGKKAYISEMEWRLSS